MKPLGDAFIKMIKMIIAPIIFCTVVHGIASMSDMKKVGRVGLKALIYFEVLTTIALIVGLIVVNTLKPGAGMNVDVSTLDTTLDPGVRREVQGTGHDPVPDGRHPQHGRRRIRIGRDPAGAVLRHPVRVRAAGARRARQVAAQCDRPGLIRAVRRRRHHHEGRTDRRVRRDGLHDRQIRHRDAAVARPADGGLLRDLHHLRCFRARLLRLARRFQHLQVHPLHQGRAADRARHVVLRVRAAAHDGQDGKSGLREVRRRPRDPDRILVQSGRHLHLPDDGGPVSSRRRPARTSLSPSSSASSASCC